MERASDADPMLLPDGTVTFLFTDIEGSTRLWEKQPEAMPLALARHDRLLRRSIKANDGLLVKSTGDGLQAVFTTPRDALGAALAAQRALAAEPWPEATGQLWVRMALHTASAELRDGDYYGSAVNRVARLMDAGHGGQTLLSLAVEELVRDDLPGGVTLIDLGRHRLKDLTRPEHIFQLAVPDLPQDFPELNTSRARPSNLPLQPTSFIGREQELADVSALLERDDVSLVTLTGSGGIGKTRLALQLANDLLAEDNGPFTDGAFFVDLVTLDDPQMIATTIATVLGVGESGDHPLDESLQEYLRTKSILLVLDNLEHLLEGVGLLSQILQGAPGIKFLATSREALNLREEWLYPLDGLPYPTESTAIDISNFSAVQLFTATAMRLRPDFNLAEEGAGVIRICRLVEGTPLAIELAAVWTKSLASQIIADEIQRSADFLDARLRNLPVRHRSMRAVFDYSWQHLSGHERKAFSRLSVFRGGFSREAAAAITGASLVVLADLVDKSLLRKDPEASRYRIHELLRQFAAEKLASDQADHDERHKAHSVYFAEYCWLQATASFSGHPHAAYRRIELESENIHAAWRWAINKQFTREIIRTVPALSIYITNKNHYLRGLAEFEKAVQVLRVADSGPNTALAIATTLVEISWLQIRLGRLDEAEKNLLDSQGIYHRLDIPPALPGQANDPAIPLGIIASIRGDFASQEQFGLEALQTSQEFDHQLNREFSYYVLTRAAVAQGQYDLAQQRAIKLVEIIQDTNDQWLLAYCQLELGNIAFGRGDLLTALNHYQEAYTIREKFDDPEGMAVALNHLGKISLRQDEYEKARQIFQRSHEIYQDIGDNGGLATACNGLANAAVGQAYYQTAQKHFLEALSVAADIHFVPLVLATLSGIGDLFIKTGQGDQGRELLLFVYRNSTAEYETRELARQKLDLAFDDIGDDLLEVKKSAGEMNGLDQLVQTIATGLAALPLSDPPSPPSTAAQTLTIDQPLVEPLTRREVEILGHIADGLTNKQIAELLIISPGTVKWYTSQIYGKLNVRSRTQAVAKAHGLDFYSG